jgi:predicted outer membrane repeat protein
MRRALFETLEQRALLSAYLVDTAADIVDGNHALGELALREAIILANENPGADSINFDASLTGQTITLLLGELGIEDDLDISGPGPSHLAVSGNNASRVFSIDAGVTASIGGLTITGGEATGASGGGIASAGNLTLTDLTVSGNNAGNGGGGIYSHASTLTLTRSTVSGNSADNYAGGIFSDGVLTLTDSTISGNNAGNGGGIYTSGTMTLTNSTLSGNTAVYAGGGIYSSSATLTLTNSTVSGNAGVSGGGGIYSGVGSDTLLVSTLVALNTGGDLNGEPLDAGSTGNLIGDSDSAGGLINASNGNIVGADPVIGPLADNGGPTWTHALLAGSPALDAGSNPLNLAGDQRGEGYPRTLGASTDIGAVEFLDSLYSLLVADGGAVMATSSAGDVHWSVIRNSAGDLVVFEEATDGWQAYRLTELPGGAAATGEPLIWYEEASGRVRVAAPSAGGLLLYTRLDPEGWSVRNLTSELGAVTPVAAMTQFTALDGRVYVAGRNGLGDLVALHQTGEDPLSSEDEWAFVNISDDLRAQGMATPSFDEMISYRTPWDAWTLAGIDGNGDIQGVWLAPSFSQWRVDNLSDITGAQPLAGQLTVTQTAWKAINLGGLDANGNVLVTWWVPGFEGHWAKSDLTAVSGGPALVNGRVTGWVTPWGAINYAGLDASGEVYAYWWTPVTNEWQASLLTGGIPGEQARPAGRLTNHASAAGAMSLWGPAENGDALRLWWSPGTNAWRLDNLSDLAVRS